MRSTFSGVSFFGGATGVLARLSTTPAVRLILLFAVLWPMASVAQDDGPSLGDVARNLRRNKTQQELDKPQPAPPVIDNDNLAQAMDDVQKVKAAARMVFSVDSSGKNFKLSSPDVSCSLSFNGRASALLIKPVLVEDLPLAELLKLDGPGSIQDENLQLELFNGTDWELQEVTVGLTLERKPGENAEVAARARVIPAAETATQPIVERRSDLTLLYHLKTTAKPFTTTTFRENIGITPGPDEDWRWSIVEAKGIRPAQAQPPPTPLPAPPPFALPSPLPPGSVSGQGTTSNAPTASTPTAGAPQVQDKPATSSDFQRR